jgi:hypothetical protein
VTASQRRTVTVLVAALGVAFLLVWSAHAGPDQVILEQRGDPATEQVDGTAPAQTDEAERADVRSPDEVQHQGTGDWVRDVTAFVLLVTGLLVTGLILRQVLIRIRRRLTDERLVVPLAPRPDLEKARATLDREQEQQWKALAGPDVRNGVVACWVVFEDAAAAAGVARQPAETATAFVVRFLHLLDVDPRAVGDLAQLFLEARFSSHPLAPDARARAERALQAIHLDLAHARASS